MSNFRNTVFYIGVTNNLRRRIYEHKKCLVKGFTNKYKIKKLLYYEEYDEAIIAIEREKKLKRWRRSWKLELIRKMNPDFKDLYTAII